MQASPGEYGLTITARGFRTLERPGINLTAAERLAAGTFTLDVGAVEERVTAAARTAPVQLENLLIRGGNVTAPMSLLPGVVDPAANAGEQPAPGDMTELECAGNFSQSVDVNDAAFRLPARNPRIIQLSIRA